MYGVRQFAIEILIKKSILYRRHRYVFCPALQLLELIAVHLPDASELFDLFPAVTRATFTFGDQPLLQSICRNIGKF